MTRLRVELVVPTLHVGGMERLVIFMAREFRHQGIDAGITVIEELGSLAEEAVDSGIPVTLVRTPGILTNFTAPALRDHFRNRRLHVVHAHSGVWLKAARAARAAGVPGVVHTFHGVVQDEAWHVNPMRRLASRCTDEIIAVSDSLKRVLNEQAGIPNERIGVVINGVDTRRFAPRTQLVSRMEHGQPFVVGHVARLDPIKNQEMLLRAFAELSSTLPSARLVIAGDGPLRNTLEALVSSLGLESTVNFAGEVKDTAALYQSFDAFALSSVSEGTSMSILEAMSSGVPVVATAVGGTPALVREGKLAMLVPSNDARGMARALAQLANDPAKRESLASTARVFTVNHYSSDVMLQRYTEIYSRFASEAQA